MLMVQGAPGASFSGARLMCEHDIRDQREACTHRLRRHVSDSWLVYRVKSLTEQWTHTLHILSGSVVLVQEQLLLQPSAAPRPWGSPRATSAGAGCPVAGVSEGVEVAADPVALEHVLDGSPGQYIFLETHPFPCINYRWAGETDH